MLISLDWLGEYVDLPPTSELTARLTLAGLNLEGTSAVGHDVQIDLEVTSNRSDCLGHLGVAREVAVLWGRTLRESDPQPSSGKRNVHQGVQVVVQSPQLCPRYTARRITGVTIGPSPGWLVRRLQTVGVAVINNVVDVTNYVMLECGQPLHAFDFSQISQGQIIVRAAIAGERFAAIDHRQYELTSGTCVIADAQRAIALAGVMGGMETEVSSATTDVLIEAAAFDPLAVRRTARRLGLHSPSSYRFERGVDPERIDWASRRCCELILELAGGELAAGAVDVGAPTADRQPIVLRWAQIERLLGIVIPQGRVRQILTALGMREIEADARQIAAIPPSWRADLTREADLIEEAARIYGYEKIPEDSHVGMTSSQRTHSDRVLDRVRGALTSCGFDEAMTLSAIDPEWVDAFPAWTQAPPFATSTPLLRRANCLRQSLVPSLLAARRHNEKLSNPQIELFEIAHAYLPGTEGRFADEKRLLSLTSGGDFRDVKGVVEGVLEALALEGELDVAPCEVALLEPQLRCQLRLRRGDQSDVLGYLGELSASGRGRFDLRGRATIAEIDLGLLLAHAQLGSRVASLSPYPPVARDLNIVVDEGVSWAEAARIAREAGGDLVEAIAFLDEYRDAEKLGAGKKSLLFSILLRSPEGTLTSERADEVRDAIVAQLAVRIGGRLRA